MQPLLQQQGASRLLIRLSAISAGSISPGELKKPFLDLAGTSICSYTVGNVNEGPGLFRSVGRAIGVSAAPWRIMHPASEDG